MNMNDSPQKFPAKTHVVIASLATTASLVGSLSAVSGNIAIQIATAVIIGIGCMAYFFVIKKIHESKKNTDNLSSAHTGDSGGIPTDRIDPVTGLANENGLLAWFAEKGPRIIADGKGIVLLVSDLVDFNQIERTKGKAISDAVLIEVAKRVQSCAGSEGIASRPTGGQFAAVATVVPSNSAEVAAEQAGKLADLMQRPVELASGIIWIGGSVGAAYGTSTNADEILGRARAALKKAVQIGRGHYVVDNS